MKSRLFTLFIHASEIPSLLRNMPRLTHTVEFFPKAYLCGLYADKYPKSVRNELRASACFQGSDLVRGSDADCRIDSSRTDCLLLRDSHFHSLTHTVIQIRGASSNGSVCQGSQCSTHGNLLTAQGILSILHTYGTHAILHDGLDAHGICLPGHLIFGIEESGIRFDGAFAQIHAMCGLGKLLCRLIESNVPVMTKS